MLHSPPELTSSLTITVIHSLIHPISPQPTSLTHPPPPPPSPPVTSSLIVLSPYGPSTALRLDDIDVTASLDYLFKRKVQHGRQRFVQGRAIPGVPPFFEAGPKTLFQVIG